MNCLHCNMPLENTYICPRCGHKDPVARKIIYTSNRHYNEGLEKAKVRDLSGAAESLRQALKYNKRNMQARNLLGLVYYQMGELVDALSEWVISVHFQDYDNPASDYIKKVQNSQDKLKQANKVIRRYNTAISYIQENNAEMAIIELGRVISMNPNYVKAHQLLALLYMQRKQYSAARKVLAAAVKVDRNNMQTLGYVRELNQLQEKPTREQRRLESRRIADPNPIVIEESSGNTYRDYNTGFVSFINVIIGIVIGAAVIWLLLVPSITKKQAGEYNEAIVEYSAQISERNREITSLEEEIESLNTQLAEYDGTETTAAATEDTSGDEHLVQAVSLYLQDSILSCGMELSEIDPDTVTDADKRRIYEILVNATKDSATGTLYANALESFDDGNYMETVEGMTRVLRLDATYSGAVYYMARSYHLLGDAVNAMTYYQQVISVFPDSEYYSEASNYYEQLQRTTGVTITETEAETETETETEESAE